jgi:SOS-response transcriptional repressor LexA
MIKEGELLRLKIRGTGKTVEEAAELLGKTRRMLYNYFKEDELDTAFKAEIKEKLNLEIVNVPVAQDVQQSNVEITGIILHNSDTPPKLSYLDKRRKQKLSTPKSDDGGEDTKHGVPVYDAVIDASFIERYNDTSLYTPIYYIDIPRLRNCDFAVFVKGSSMYPLMKSGTVAFIRVVDRFDYFDEGEMYFISTTNGFETVKYVQHGDTPDELKLIPHNEKIKAATIKKDMVVKMCIVEAWLNFR